MKRRIAALVGLVAALAVTLAGCSSWTQASTAAQVNGQTITMTQVQQLADALVSATKTSSSPISAGDAPVVALQGLFTAAVLDTASDKGASVVTSDSVSQVMAQDPVAQAIAKVPGATDWARGELAISQAQSDQTAATTLLGLGKKATVTLNPRFGQWDPSSGWFSTNNGSLSVPATAAPKLP